MPFPAGFLSMNILNVIQCTNLGGMEQNTILRIQQLMRRGHNCRLVSLNEVGALATKLDEKAIPYQGIRYRQPWGLPSMASIYRAASKPECDAIIMSGHNMAAQTVLPFVKAKRKILEIHFHHSGVKSTNMWRFIYRNACHAFDVITFASKFIRDEALDILPELEDKSIVLPYPYELPSVPTSEQRLKYRTEFGLKPDDLVIGNAGWLIERKRFDVLLKVCAVLREDFPTLRIFIAGDGPLRSSLEALARDLGLTEHTRFCGWLPDLYAFYSALDLLLFNTDWEALGRTPIEAISLGTPVVASAIHSGLEEILLPRFAPVIKQHNVSQLASLCREVLLDRERSRAKALLARDYLAGFSPEADCIRLEELLWQR